MIYFDSAATSLQKPPTVARAVERSVRCCASPGRGGYAAARRAEETLFACRTELAELFGAESPEQIAFTMNATHALNLAIRTMVHPGDRVLISAWEHNAVTRTLASIPDVAVQVAEAPLFDDEGTLRAFEDQLEQGVQCVVCTVMSNVFGYMLPIEDISRLCREYEVPLILDASQGAGAVSLDFRSLRPAFMAFPGHKGLYGPQGTGVLICGQNPEPLLTGGTGSSSLLQEMPDYLPDRAEAGTHNVMGIAGLLEGVRFVRGQGTERILAHEMGLKQLLGEQLLLMPGVRPILSVKNNQGGVLSFWVDGMDCEEVAARLGERNIAVRAGLHCAPLAHRSQGTLETGTVRVSFSRFNSGEEVCAFCRVLNMIVNNKLT